MQMRDCGKSGLKISALGVGCWSFGGGQYWGAQAQEDVDQVVRRAVELGITYFDTAEAYNEGSGPRSVPPIRLRPCWPNTVRPASDGWAPNT